MAAQIKMPEASWSAAGAGPGGRFEHDWLDLQSFNSNCGPGG